MTRSIAAVVLAAALILAVGIAVSERRLQAAFDQSRADTRRDLDAMDATTRLIKRVVDMETGERGFLITGEERFFEPYRSARTEIPQLIARMRTTFAGEPARLADVDAIVATLDQWHRSAGDVEIEMRRREGALTSELVAQVAAGTGKKLIDEVRAQMDRMFADESRQREARTAMLEASRILARRTVATSGALAGSVALLFGLLASLRFRRGVGHLISASEQIARGDFKSPVPYEAPPLDRLAASLGATAEALAEREHQAEALLAVGRSDGGADLAAVLGAVRRGIGPVLAVDALSLLAVDGASLQRLATFPGDLFAGGMRRPIQGSALESAVASREPVVVTDVSDERYSENPLARQIGASCYVLVPLVSNDAVYAALVLLSRRPLDFSPSVMRFVRTLGRQLSSLVASFQLRQQVNQRNGELERANRAKSEFLAMMSHELRTPLNSIIGFSDVLIDGAFGSLNERQGRYVRNVNDSGRHLLRLINDLLDMSKIEAGRLEVMIDRCAPRVLIVDALAALQPLADQKKIHMEVTSLEAPPAVLADPVRLKQVLYNLLSNALKFTPEGGRVTVSFAVLSGGQRVRVTVRDSGPGIADADLAKLFVPFSQLDNARHDPRAGTGLGLALTKQLVELMDGTIYVDNAPEGGGTAFAIELPVATAAPELTSTAPPDAPLVLLVDDDAAARELVQLTLGSHYRLATAGTGEEALVRARELKPDVILLDVFLPGMDGWEVLRALRQNPETRDLPVVLVTISTDRHTSFTLGAVDHLVKPVSSETLLAALARRSLVKRALLGSVRVLVVDDDRRHCELVRAMLEPHGFTVRTELTGAGGIAAARDERFDLMLLDLVMPDLSGVEVVEALREGGKSPDMPIIVLTANQLSAEDRKRLAGSIAAVMAKGATGPDQLVGEIHRVLERK